MQNLDKMYRVGDLSLTREKKKLLLKLTDLASQSSKINFSDCSN